MQNYSFINNNMTVEIIRAPFKKGDIVISNDGKRLLCITSDMNPKDVGLDAVIIIEPDDDYSGPYLVSDYQLFKGTITVDR